MTQLVETIADLRAIRWQDPSLTWGLVPTMGALHEGHIALVRQARRDNDRVAVSIFVNPTQFNDPADLEKYPRNLAQDIEMLRAENVDLAWSPPVNEMYPHGFQTSVIVKELTRPLEGEHRPGHFEGVATVVAKLFNAVQPTRAYFGQKDVQQVAVIKRMVRDLNFNLDVVVHPTVREADGLALSSRNSRLSPGERTAAAVLYRALSVAKSRFDSGETDAAALRQMMTDIINDEPLSRIDYVSVAHPDTLQEFTGDVEQALLSLAVYIGEIRLIDNMVIG
ncbi:MAG: pantoate--beta-alanine ligase [Chloroflexi bacterium]|nr:pantoate--beta-alanine ligase [Chloroflexota bacterium]